MLRNHNENEAYKSIKSGDFTLTKCFENHPSVREKINTLWENVSTVDSFLKIREPTDEQCNAAASVCQEWCKIYPVFFPDKNLTRKMTEWSLVLPWFIREKKELCNKMLRLEQAGEELHRQFNGIERTKKQILFKPKRYFDVLKEYENKLYCDSSADEPED